MRTILSPQFAARSIIAILSTMIFFHLLVIAGVVPFNIVWGGRLTDRESVLPFELISISSLSLMLLVVAVKSEIIRWRIRPVVIRIALWLMLALFLLNTLGNLASLNTFERYFFSPLTLLLSFFCVVLLLPDRKTEKAG